MSDNYSPLADFYALSVVLTGFSDFDLHGTGVGQTYYQTVNDKVGTGIVAELLQQFREIEQACGGNGRALEQQLRIFILSDPKFGPVARNIIKLWYLGSWNQLPDSWWTSYGGASVTNEAFVVSAQAYSEGLVWKPMLAHPMGAKQPGYGTWSYPPDPDHHSD